MRFNREAISEPVSDDRVWYACYGSNLSRWRIMCYLEGTSPTEGGTKHEGARDRCPPRRSVLAKTDHRVFFAGTKSRWGAGGYGFVSTHPSDADCYLVLWDLSREQFEDVFMMEAGVPVGSVLVPAPSTWRGGECVVLPENAYGTGICLGSWDGLAVCTFTSDVARQENPPSALYRKVIVDGLVDHGLAQRDAEAYVDSLTADR